VAVDGAAQVSKPRWTPGGGVVVVVVVVVVVLVLVLVLVVVVGFGGLPGLPAATDVDETARTRPTTTAFAANRSFARPFFTRGEVTTPRTS